MINSKEISYKKIPVLKIVLLLMVIISIIFQSIISYIDQEASFVGYLKDTLVTIMAESVFSLYIYFIIAFFNFIFKNKWKWIGYSLGFSIAFVGCFYILFSIFILLTNTPFTLDKLITRTSFRLHITINMVAVVFIYALITSLNFYQLMLEKSAATAQLEREYTQMRLHALRNQVNPHFLFNSLSVLSSLVRIDAETSEKFIIQLSKAYRYILEQKDTELVTLKEELGFLEAYFFLLKIRFKNKVILEKNISIDTDRYCLPPLTLQMLVENTVKHNKMSVAVPLIIQINANDESITVKNNLNPREEGVESTGMGLENIKSRIAYLTDKKIHVVTTEKYFEVYIPLVKKLNKKV
jgi:two-component system, LytTR family, sensor kinase